MTYEWIVLQKLGKNYPKSEKHCLIVKPKVTWLIATLKNIRRWKLQPARENYGYMRGNQSR